MSEADAIDVLIGAKDALRVQTNLFDDARLRLIEAERGLKAAEDGLREAVLETATSVRRVEAARILGVTPGRISQIVTGG